MWDSIITGFQTSIIQRWETGKKWRNKIIHKHEFCTLSFFSARRFIWIIKESKHDNHLNSMFAPDIIQRDLQTWEEALQVLRLNFLGHRSFLLRQPQTESRGPGVFTNLLELNLSAPVLKPVFHWWKNKIKIKMVPESPTRWFHPVFNTERVFQSYIPWGL